MAGAEQNNGEDQINKAIMQLDQVIQQNASAFEEMASTSEELSGQAEQMQAAMSFFKLDGEREVKLLTATEKQQVQAAKKVTVAHIDKQAADATGIVLKEGDGSTGQASSKNQGSLDSEFEEY